MADAADSKSVAFTGVGVRVPPRAPQNRWLSGYRQAQKIKSLDTVDVSGEQGVIFTLCGTDT